MNRQWSVILVLLVSFAAVSGANVAYSHADPLSGCALSEVGRPSALLPPACPRLIRAENRCTGITQVTIAVNSTADVAADDGQCTLREAIVAANTDTASGSTSGECLAGFGDDTIDLTRVGGTITLTGALPDIASDVVFDGPGTSNLAVRRDAATGNYRIFTIEAGATVAMLGLTVSNGSVNDDGGVGGGIYNAGTLTLINSTVISNEASFEGGGVWNVSLLTLIDSTVAGNHASDGGGIFNLRALTLTNSTVVSNGANLRGGGVFNYCGCAAELANSTIGHNQATSGGGGIYNGGGTLTLENSTVSGNNAAQGGGIDTGWGTVELINSTISDNQATSGGGGIASVGDTSYTGTLTLIHSTVGGNSADYGGGIWNDDNATVKLKNSIIARNNANSSGPNCHNSATLISLDCNLVGDDSGCTFTPQANDQVNVDSLLGELQDNGGATETRALLFGSPAVNAIPLERCTDHRGAPVATDQRGVPRPQGGACDIGAYELVQSLLYVPLVVCNYMPPATFPVHIGDAIPVRPVTLRGEVFYTTSVQIPDPLPPGGRFYFSSQPDAVAEVVVDDELAVLLNGANVFSYDFSTSGIPVPAIVEVPRPTMEQLAGRTVAIEYRDVYGQVVEASEIWLIWTP